MPCVGHALCHYLQLHLHDLAPQYFCASPFLKSKDVITSTLQHMACSVSLAIFFFLRMRLRPIVGQPGSSSRVKLGQTNELPTYFAYVGPAMWNSLPEHLRKSHPTLQQLQVLVKEPLVRTNDTSSALDTFSDKLTFYFSLHHFGLSILNVYV